MNGYLKTVSLKFAAVICFFAISSTAYAVTITEGFTFAVASDPSDRTVGTHFHSNTGGAFGNPAGKAEVGDFFGEEVRGLSEYSLAGLTNSATAFVTFNVFDLAGLFANQNDFPFDGDIDVVTYAGNNLEDISDFQAPIGTVLGTFNTAGLSVGDVLSFDITSAFNMAIDAAEMSLGVRLQIAAGVDPLGGAVTFDTFRLTTDDQTSVIPVPAAVWLFGTALIGLIGFGKRRKSV